MFYPNRPDILHFWHFCLSQLVFMGVLWQNVLFCDGRWKKTFLGWGVWHYEGHSIFFLFVFIFIYRYKLMLTRFFLSKIKNKNNQFDVWSRFGWHYWRKVYIFSNLLFTIKNYIGLMISLKTSCNHFYIVIL